MDFPYNLTSLSFDKNNGSDTHYGLNLPQQQQQHRAYSTLPTNRSAIEDYMDDDDFDDDDDTNIDNDDEDDDDIDIEDILREDSDFDNDDVEEYENHENIKFHQQYIIPSTFRSPTIANSSTDQIFKHSSNKNNNNIKNDNNDDEIDIDINDVLNEDDDDDDDDDDNYNLNLSIYKTTGSAVIATKHASAQSTVFTRGPTTKQQEHLPEDWAVLQQILSEHDDNDDEDGNDHHQHHHNVILNNEHQSLVRMNDSVSVSISNSSPKRNISGLDHHISPRTDDDDKYNNINHDDEDDMKLEYTSSSFRSKYGVSDKDTSSSTSYRTKVDDRTVSQQNATNTAGPPIDDNERMYEKSIAYAQMLERKLCKSGGGREIISPLLVKRRLKPRIELSARKVTTHEQQQSSSNDNNNNHNDKSLTLKMHKLHGPRFSFSGIVDNKSMTKISPSIVKHSQRGMTKVYCGLPTSIAFNTKFIAIGTQIGIILIYDLFEVLRQRLGGASHIDDNNNPQQIRNSIAGAITSLDLSQNGDTVIAGYSSGLIVLWDTIRGIVLRSVESHPSPITCIRFLKDLKVVAVDSSGLVNTVTFAKNLLWAHYSMEIECLLDGSAGQILSMHVLQPYNTVKPLVRPEKVGKVLRRLTLISLASERSSFAVAVEPKVHVLHRWPRPPPDKTNIVHSTTQTTTANDPTSVSTENLYLPCLAWGWALSSGGGNVVMPVLARAWGCCLQLLCTSFPTLDDDPTHLNKDDVLHWPAFGVQNEIDAISPIVSLEWLNERSIAYLTASYELTLIDSVMMTLLERLDFSDVKLVYAEFTLSRAAEKLGSDNIVDSISGACCTTFLNSTRCSDDRIMMICQDELRCISIVGARQRISALEADGEWLEALAFALDHYENITSQEDRRRDPNSRKDLTRHPEFSAAKNDEEEWIGKLLIRYLNLAVENAPDASDHQSITYSPHNDVSSRIDLAQSHFQMLAGVCVEFCVATRRLDLLFGPIFRRFQSAGYIAVFLDVLEPYVLNDKLKYIAPEVMSFLVEHCKASTVERCLLHMDCTIMDFDSILTLLRANEMYTALFYVFNQGLDEYVTPLEIVLEKVFNEADKGGASVPRRKDGVLQNDFERLGYKALLYLQACFSGKTFPQETTLEPESRLISLKSELLKFLMQKHFTPSTHVKKAVNLIPEVGQRSLLFPYIRVLLLVDPRGLLQTIAIAIDSTSTQLIDGRSRSVSDSADDWVDGVATNSNHLLPQPNLQEIMDNIAALLLHPVDQTLLEGNIFKARGAVNAFLSFLAKYIISGAVRMSKPIVFMVLSRVAEQHSSSQDTSSRQMYQRKAMEILSALPRDSYEPDQILVVINQSGMHRAALLLHQQVATSWHEGGQDDMALRSQHFLSAIDCYIEDDEPEFRLEVFKYVKKECSGVEKVNHSGDHTKPMSLRDALFLRLVVLVHLDPIQTASLVAQLLIDDLDQVIHSLQSDDGKAQFMFLQAIISGKLLDADPVAGSVINLTMDHHHTYLKLLARMHPEMVYDYLSTHDNYRTEECLRLCEECDIADASAYLLERMGKVTNALDLILQTLETRMMALKRSIRSFGSDFVRNTGVISKSRFGTLSGSNSKHENEVNGVRRLLIVALDVCERNSGSYSSSLNYDALNLSKYKQSELWFSVLDRLINAKGFLRLSKEQPEHAKVMSGVLSELLRLTMQRMVSSVPLSDLVRKVTAEHSGSQIGELREMVEGLLATYGFELRVVKNAILSFYDDIHKLRHQQLSLQVQGLVIQSIMNAELKQIENRKDGQKSTAIIPISNPIVHASVLRVSSNNRNAVLITNDAYTAALLSSSHRSENGLLDSMKRLRSRRSMYGSTNHTTNKWNTSITNSNNSSINNTNNIKKSDMSYVSISDISMITMIDRMYNNYETEAVVDTIDPIIGNLSEAQHRGRLIMSFNHRY